MVRESCSQLSKTESFGRACGLAAKLCRPGPHGVLHCHGFFAALELGTVSLPCSMQWVLFGVVAWGVRVIPLSPPPQGAFQCMLSQAEGRSEYVSPMGSLLVRMRWVPTLRLDPHGWAVTGFVWGLFEALAVHSSWSSR